MEIIFPRRHLTSVVKSRRCKKSERGKVEASSSVAIKQYWHLIKITRRRKDSFDVNFFEWGAPGKWRESRSLSCFVFVAVYSFTTFSSLLVEKPLRGKVQLFCVISPNHCRDKGEMMIFVFALFISITFHIFFLSSDFDPEPSLR